MSINILEYTHAELAGAIPKEMPELDEDKIITFAEFKQLEEELEEKQEKRLAKCTNVDGDWRCEKCGSSMWNSEVRFQYVHRETKKPTGTLYTVKKVWYCININCEKPPPLVGSFGIIRPARKNENQTEDEDKIRGRIEPAYKKLG